MTVTFADEGWPSKGPGARDLWVGVSWGRLYRAIKAWSSTLMAAGRRDRSSDMVMGVHEKGLHAVADYARFLAAHPEMPGAHRDRFLRAMIRCCEDLRAGGS